MRKTFKINGTNYGIANNLVFPQEGIRYMLMVEGDDGWKPLKGFYTISEAVRYAKKIETEKKYGD